jgi:GNAT superfamily N-acetyltransferase
MREVPPSRALLSYWLNDEQPGCDAIAGHVLFTGHGRCWTTATGLVTRQGRSGDAVLVETAGNYLLAGDPSGVDPNLIRGFLSAPADVAAGLPGAIAWPRVVYHLPSLVSNVDGGSARRLSAADADAIADLDPELAWISKTWGGPAGLAASGHAWGAFGRSHLVAVAVSFFVGLRHEELGVVTDSRYRGQGFGTACVRGLCSDVAARGRVPSWSTGVDNRASRRLAERIGFEFVRLDVLYAVNVEIPA